MYSYISCKIKSSFKNIKRITRSRQADDPEGRDLERPFCLVHLDSAEFDA